MDTTPLSGAFTCTFWTPCVKPPPQYSLGIHAENSTLCFAQKSQCYAAAADVLLPYSHNDSSNWRSTFRVRRILRLGCLGFNIHTHSESGTESQLYNVVTLYMQKIRYFWSPPPEGAYSKHIIFQEGLTQEASFWVLETLFIMASILTLTRQPHSAISNAPPAPWCVKLKGKPHFFKNPTLSFLEGLLTDQWAFWAQNNPTSGFQKWMQFFGLLLPPPPPGFSSSNF